MKAKCKDCFREHDIEADVKLVICGCGGLVFDRDDSQQTDGQGFGSVKSEMGSEWSSSADKNILIEIHRKMSEILSNSKYYHFTDKQHRLLLKSFEKLDEIDFINDSQQLKLHDDIADREEALK